MPDAVVSKHPQVRLLKETEPGPGPARNKGVAEAKGEILAFTDADCVIDAGWLARIADHFAQNPDIHAIGGDVYILRAQPDNATPLEAYEGVYAFRTRMYIEKMGFTATNNLSVRAHTMARVGKFGGKEIAEDRDWGHRARDMGYPSSTTRPARHLGNCAKNGTAIRLMIM
jgi:glycosyltransferase involved in cell wall biosynthesis